MKLTKSASAVLLSGLAIRLGLAPFTGHPGDLALFVTSQRLFYQTGTIDLKYFPTLPGIYYVQLLFYAPYQLLRLTGMPDFQDYYHTTMMIEGLSLKLPLILSDIDTDNDELLLAAGHRLSTERGGRRGEVGRAFGS